MECDQFLQRLCNDLAEDINSEVCAALKKHLQTCETCQQQVRSMRNTVNLFRCLDEKEVPPNIHERLVKMLNVADAG
jgi:hypothetical protein